jgi:hypothetical protein
MEHDDILQEEIISFKEIRKKEKEYKWFLKLLEKRNIKIILYKITFDKKRFSKRKIDWNWYDGQWNDGTWDGGIWHNGDWNRGIWKGGTWKDGWWLRGTWHDGTWENGHWHDGDWLDGTWKNGSWDGGTWHNGIWENGHWITGRWLGGTWETGYIFDPHKEGNYKPNWKWTSSGMAVKSPISPAEYWKGKKTGLMYVKLEENMNPLEELLLESKRIYKKIQNN